METFGDTTRGISGDGMTTTDNGLYYDPYDFEIDKNPYPIWKRLRDERPLYYNEKYDFYALSRFDDVERLLQGLATLQLSEGHAAGADQGRSADPTGARSSSRTRPSTIVHRALLTDVFKPRRIAALEPKVREFCARSLEPLVAKGGFDFVADIGAPVPMRTIGMLLGIPDQDQEAIRDRIDDSLKLREGAPTDEMLARMGKNHKRGLRRIHRLASQESVR